MWATTAWNPACWSDSRTSSSTSGLVLKMAMMRDFPSKAPSGATRKLRRLSRASKPCPCSLVPGPGERQVKVAALVPAHAGSQRAAVRLRRPAGQREHREIRQAIALQLAAVADGEGHARRRVPRLETQVDGRAGPRDVQRGPEDSTDGGSDEARIRLDPQRRAAVESTTRTFLAGAPSSAAADCASSSTGARRTLDVRSPPALSASSSSVSSIPSRRADRLVSRSRAARESAMAPRRRSEIQASLAAVVELRSSCARRARRPSPGGGARARVPARSAPGPPLRRGQSVAERPLLQGRHLRDRLQHGIAEIVAEKAALHRGPLRVRRRGGSPRAHRAEAPVQSAVRCLEQFRQDLGGGCVEREARFGGSAELPLPTLDQLRLLPGEGIAHSIHGNAPDDPDPLQFRGTSISETQAAQ